LIGIFFQDYFVLTFSHGIVATLIFGVLSLAVLFYFKKSRVSGGVYALLFFSLGIVSHCLHSQSASEKHFQTREFGHFKLLKKLNSTEKI